MAGFGDYLENALLSHTLRNVSYTPPTSVYIALFTADNGIEGGDITGEVSTSGTAYARLEVGGSTGRSFSSPAGGISSNSEIWTWATATANWGDVSFMAVLDVADNVLYHAALTSTRTINNLDTFSFAAGDVQISLS